MLYTIIFFGMWLLGLVFTIYCTFFGKPLLISGFLLNVGGVFFAFGNPSFRLLNLDPILYENSSGFKYYMVVFYALIGGSIISATFLFGKNTYYLRNVSISSTEVLKKVYERLALSIGDKTVTSITLGERKIDLNKVEDKELRKDLLREIRYIIEEYGKPNKKDAFSLCLIFIMITIAAYQEIGKLL